MLHSLVLAAGLLASPPPNACSGRVTAAHIPQYGVVYGQIEDESGAPIPRADVVLKAVSGKRQYGAADENGCYMFSTEAGDYTVLARYPAFRIGSVSMHIEPEQAQVKNLHLDVASCTNCVEVQGAATFSACIRDAQGYIASSTVTLTPKNPLTSKPITVHLDDWGCGRLQPPEGVYQLDVVTPGFFALRKVLDLKSGPESPRETLIVRPLKH